MLHQLFVVGVAAFVALLMGITAPEAKLFELHNDARARHNLPALQLHEQMTYDAQLHSRRMARQQRLFHGDYPSCAPWGQNVGVGPSVKAVFRAFMKSHPHRVNILNPDFRWLGVGVTVDRYGARWVTANFCVSR